MRPVREGGGTGANGGAGGIGATGGTGGASQSQGGAGGGPGGGGAGPAQDAAEPDLGSGDAPAVDVPGAEAGDAAGAMPRAPLGTKVSLDPQILQRWMPAPHRRVAMDGDKRIFTGQFYAGKFSGGMNGHIIRFAITPGSEYVLEYRMRFDPGFDFSRGGKIPGLQGASAPSGCKRSDSLGFSAREMWREGGRVIGYIYDMDQSGACGNAIATGFNFSVGRWYSIKKRIKLNTGRNRDGVLQVSIDDRMIINRSNMGWMVESPDRRIDEMMLDFFFGGSTADWAPSRDCSISFSDMFVTRLAD
jgi:hypothetical protein